MHQFLILAAASKASGSSSSSLFLLLILVLVAAFMFMRPGRKKARQQQQEMRKQIVPGAEIRTNAGLYATVSAVGDDFVTLEVAPGVLSRYDPRAVVAVVNPAPASVGYGEPAVAGEAAVASAAPEAGEEPAETHQS